MEAGRRVSGQTKSLGSMPNFFIREINVVRFCRTFGRAVCASNTTFCLAQYAHDLLPLLLVTFFDCASRGPLDDFADRFSYNPRNFVMRAVVVRYGFSYC